MSADVVINFVAGASKCVAILCMYGEAVTGRIW